MLSGTKGKKNSGIFLASVCPLEYKNGQTFDRPFFQTSRVHFKHSVIDEKSLKWHFFFHFFLSHNSKLFQYKYPNYIFFQDFSFCKGTSKYFTPQDKCKRKKFRWTTYGNARYVGHWSTIYIFDQMIR